MSPTPLPRGVIGFLLSTTMVGDDGKLHLEASRHRDGQAAGLLEYAALLDRVLNDGSLQQRVQRTGQPLLIPSFESRQSEVSDDVMRVSRELGLHSGIVVPLIARRRVLGALALVSGSSGRTFTADDLDTAADLGRRAGLSLDNARLYEREHRTAETLQANMLPVLPGVAGLEVAVAYLAGDAAASVGGDFYELLELSDSSIAVAVGDVVGHDMTAAVQMGQLRSHFRGCLWEAAADGSADPALVLQRLDRLVQGLGVAPMASLFHVSLTRPMTGRADWTVAYSNAGHPHALLRTPEGDVTQLDQADGILLGIQAEDRVTATCRAPAGSQLVFFTDGLIERRGSDLDAGVRSLLAAIAVLPTHASVGAVRDALVTHAGPDRSDDIAVLVVGLR